MSELLQTSIAPYILPATALLVICLVYWLLVIMGALDIDAVDIGGGDAGGGVDVDLDLDVEADAGGAPGWWVGLLEFLNLLEVPVIVFLTVTSMSWWFLLVTFTPILNPAGLISIGVGLLFGAMTVSLLLAKFVTQPLKPLFKRLNQGESKIEIVGQEGTVKTTEVTETFGQIEIQKDGAPLVVNARVGEGADPISEGETVIVFREERKKGIYFIRKI